MKVFDGESLNVLVAGGGGIGAALVADLLARDNVARIFSLQRQPRGLSADSRLLELACDALDEASMDAAVDRITGECDHLHLAINAVGMLHGDTLRPEKRLRDLRPDALQTLFAVNAMFLPLLARRLGPLLRHREPAVLASLSARVGSIGDNHLGGWYSYRAAKAAQNQLLRTLALEWRRRLPLGCVSLLHPGTTATPLSEPFQANVPPAQLFSPERSAGLLLDVLERLAPEQSGGFWAWDGQPIPW